MKSSKTLAALVTLGLAAAVATPAMALENQFNGSFATTYDLSNFSAVGVPAKDANTENYLFQRVRLNYTAKASETVKLVTSFQVDYKFWGMDAGAPTARGGSALGSRGINIQTKNLFLDLNLPAQANAKIGVQGLSDAFKGIIVSSEAAGVTLTHSYAKATATAGFYRFGDSYSFYNNDGSTANAAPNAIGRNTQDMFLLDGKYNINKESTVGAAYYYIADNRQANVTTINDAKVSTLGLNAETAIGPVTINGFALAQFGDINSTTKAKGYAFNFGAKMPLAGGTTRTEFIYVAGGKNALYIPNGDEGGGFYDNEMVILSRDKNAQNLDTAIVYNVNNNNQGVIMGSLGYDYPFTPKLSGSVNLGFGATAKDKDFLGTEVNCETNYKLTPEVTLGARAGYMVLGDAFKNSDAGKTPDNPYDVKLIAKFSF